MSNSEKRVSDSPYGGRYGSRRSLPTPNHYQRQKMTMDEDGMPNIYEGESRHRCTMTRKLTKAIRDIREAGRLAVSGHHH